MRSKWNSLVSTCCLSLTVFLWPGISGQADAATGEPRPKLLFIAGPCQHPKGTHEAAAGARLLKHLAENSKGLAEAESVVLDHWPQDEKVLNDVATVVFIGDIFPPERMDTPEAVKESVGRLMKRGVGIVCLHFATALRADHVAKDGYHPLLDWLGGYYAFKCPHHSSVALVCTATITPEDDSHPVLRGWREFTFDDEPYWNIYFGKNGPGKMVTPLASSMLPPNNPQKETVAWAVTREGGGRGVGIVLPHYFRSWLIDDLRTLVLNAVGWTAKLDVPIEGVRSPVPDLAIFRPESVNPQPPVQVK